MSALINKKVKKYLKMLMILAVLCMCFANVAYAQTLLRCQYRVNDLNAPHSDHPIWVHPFADVLTATLHSTGQPVDGVVCGYMDGRIVSETPYKNGKPEGIQIIYRGIFINGESGKVFQETPYRSGIVEGILRDYFESGRLDSEVHFKNGKREGYGQSYTENGRLLLRILYRNDEPISGNCGNGRVLTSAELINFENGHYPTCTPQR